MFKKSLFHGVSAGILSGFACYVFTTMLKDEFMYEFQDVLPALKLFGACMFGCVLASIGFWSITKLTPKYGEIIFNIIFSFIIFASLIGPMTFHLPLDFDEDLTVIFPTFAMTLHFFPALIWFALKPIFIK